MMQKTCREAENGNRRKHRMKHSAAMMMYEMCMGMSMRMMRCASQYRVLSRI